MKNELNGRLLFKAELRKLNRERLKVQTRRLGEKPSHDVGDLVAHCEPVQIIDYEISSARISYLDSGVFCWVNVSKSSQQKLEKRKDLYKPTIHRYMLHDFARHALRIKGVRTEKLQLITDDDALVEGVQPWREKFIFWRGGDRNIVADTPKEVYAELWDSIHNKSGEQFADNPIVTVYDYEFVVLGEDG